MKTEEVVKQDLLLSDKYTPSRWLLASWEPVSVPLSQIKQQHTKKNKQQNLRKTQTYLQRLKSLLVPLPLASNSVLIKAVAVPSSPQICISVAFGCPKLNVNCHVN